MAALAPAVRGWRAPAAVPVGYCTGLANVAAARAAGFDYVELGVTEIAGLADDRFETAASELARAGMPTPTANLFLPSTLKVTGPEIDPDAQMAYVRRALDRVKRLGVELVVFGSGGARRVPDGFARAEAFAQLVDFGRRAAVEARARGIVLVVEPLRREETNIINSAAEGLSLVKAVDHPNFQLMIDFYHLASEREDPAIVFEARGHLRHLHMANPRGRVFPRDWSEYDYAAFFTDLRLVGYRGRISVEASTTALQADAPMAIALLKKAFDG